MPRRVVLIGHCGPDSSYLRMTVSRAMRDAQVTMADDDADLSQILASSAKASEDVLLLINRTLDYGFEDSAGSELIRRLRNTHPQVRTMLVSNYPQAQAEAVAAGALPGFGKRDLGAPRVCELLRQVFAGAKTTLGQ